MELQNKEHNSSTDRVTLLQWYTPEWVHFIQQMKSTVAYLYILMNFKHSKSTDCLKTCGNESHKKEGKGRGEGEGKGEKKQQAYFRQYMLLSSIWLTCTLENIQGTSEKASTEN